MCGFSRYSAILRTVDGGLAWSLPQHAVSLDATYFHTDVTDRITTARAAFAAGRRPTTPGGAAIASIETSANAGQARIRGVEASLRYDLGRTLSERDTGMMQCAVNAWIWRDLPGCLRASFVRVFVVVEELLATLLLRRQAAEHSARPHASDTANAGCAETSVGRG